MHRNSRRIIRIDPVYPQPEFIHEAVEILRAGGIVMFPTMGLYGLGVDAANPRAVERVYQLKQRPAEKPLLVLIGEITDLDKLVRHIPDAASKIMNNLWPGGVTLVFHAWESVSERLTAGTGKIGVRMPVHPVAIALCRQMGSPITGTSANLSGQKGCCEIDELDISMTEKLDLILDAGALPGGPGSTVVDVTVDPPMVLRIGSISKRQLFPGPTP